jgi:hypothetical protein
LNGVHPKRTDGADIQAGVTIDQMAAQKVGQDTLLPSLELAIEDYSGLVGSCDVGFSCTYMNTISWRTPTSPLPMEINPRVVFDRMFGDGASAQERLQRIETQRSILDAITGQVRRLQGDLGTRDRNRVAEYLDSVREIRTAHPAGGTPGVEPEHRCADDAGRYSRGLRGAHEADVRPDGDRVPGRHYADLDVHDGSEVSYRTFPKLGISEAFHPASHHQNSPTRLETLQKINQHHVSLVDAFPRPA